MRNWLMLVPLIWVIAFFAVLGWWPDEAYNAQRYFEWLLLGCLLIVGVMTPVRLVLSHVMAWVLLMLAALALLAVASSEQGWLALRYLLAYIALGGAALSIAKVRVNVGARVFDRAALLGVVLFCFGTSLIALEGLVLAMVGGSLTQTSIFGAFANVRMFSDVQFATLLLLPAAGLLATTHGMRVFVWITAAFWWGWLFFSGTRTALVTLPFALLAVWLVAGRQSWPWFRQVFLQAMAGALVFAVLRLMVWGSGFALGGSLSYVRDSSSGRLALWQDAWRHFLQHPWLGEGPGSFACFTSEVAAKPHNLLLLLLSEWGGLITLTTLVALGGSLVAVARCLRRSDGDVLGYSLFASVLAILVASQFEGVLIAPLGQMTAILVMGWALGKFASNRLIVLSVDEQAKPRGWRLLRWPLVMVLLPMWLVMAKADLVLQQNLLVVPKQAQQWTYWPRYWLEGHDYCPDWRQRYEQKMFAAPSGG